MGIIDPYTENSLHDFVEGGLTAGVDHYDYHGFHLTPQGAGTDVFHAQLDGHAGVVERFNASEYDDVLELVKDLNRLVIRLGEFRYSDGKEELVEWAGKIMTSDQERVDKNPDLYMHVPDDAPEFDADEVFDE